jgi:hypothetical protein
MSESKEHKIDIVKQETSEEIKLEDSKVSKYKPPKKISLTKNLTCNPYGRLMGQICQVLLIFTGLITIFASAFHPDRFRTNTNPVNPTKVIEDWYWVCKKLFKK